MSQEISKSNLLMGDGYPKFEFFESENSYGEIGFLKLILKIITDFRIPDPSLQG